LIESSIRPINTALSAKPLRIQKDILATAGGPSMLPWESTCVEALWQLGRRCEFHSIECSVRRINMALSAKLLYILKAIMASPGGAIMLP
jgi:hypothetical protein